MITNAAPMVSVFDPPDVLAPVTAPEAGAIDGGSARDGDDAAGMSAPDVGVIPREETPWFDDTP